VNGAKVAGLTTKVNDLVTAGGEPNKLEGIKVNGTLLALTDKIADILIAEGKTNGVYGCSLKTSLSRSSTSLSEAVLSGVLPPGSLEAKASFSISSTDGR